MKFLLLLGALFFFAACGPGPTVTVEVCAVSGLVPGIWCLSKIWKKFKKGKEPKLPCTACHEPTVPVCDETGKRAVVNCPAHDVPESEAPAFYCRRHARNALASPWLVMAWLDLQSKVQRYTDAEVEVFARRMWEAGIRYIRIFYPGWDDGAGDCIFPYMREADGRWNLDKPNPIYDDNLRRLAVVLGKYEVGLYVDMTDGCSWPEYWDCWRRNVNGIQGWMDESPAAFAHWKAAVDRVLLATGGPEGNLVGLGNELQRPDDADVTLAWALAWAKPRVDYLVSLGIAKPITISCGGRTGHKILGAISDEDGNYPDNSFLAGVCHGIGLVIHIPAKDDAHPNGFTSLEDWLQNYSKFHLLGYSDDGTDTSGPNGWNYIPPEKAGTYDKAGDKDASVEEKIKLMKLFLQYFKEGQLRVIEFLPRCISFDEGPDKLADSELEAFCRVGLEVFGTDPRRIF